MMILVMPSALNLPQANPSTVLEYAPVPPEEDTPPTNEGALSALGLGESGGGAGGGAPEPPKPPKLPPVKKGTSEKPSQKRCVGNPPRQTEDPMSPPCVAFYDGDNGGSTWPGVTKDEIIVMSYADVANYTRPEGGRAEVSPSNGTYCDMDAPEGQCQGPENAGTEDHVWARATRLMQRYFNERFQTYNRRVHYYLQYTNASSETATRRDAADQYAQYQPFAALDERVFFGYKDAYRDAMANRQVTMFSSEQIPHGETLLRYSPYSYNFWPDLQHASELYASYVCTKVAREPDGSPGIAKHSGNPERNGQPRKFGLMYTTDQGWEKLILFRQLTKRKLAACGVTWETEVSFPVCCWTQDNATDPSYAALNVAELESKGVTTVLWLGGTESRTTKAAASRGYLPEWVVMGDGNIDGMTDGQVQDQSAWGHAWTISYNMREDNRTTTNAWKACREADPNADLHTCLRVNQMYRDHFMLFQAIQVAGPELTPWKVDAGFHAIPRIRSTSPYLAAFYFDPDDYTGVKDAMEQWWDRACRTPTPSALNSDQGCYRMVRGGLRYPAWSWEGGDDVFANPSDPINVYDGGGFRIRLA